MVNKKLLFEIGVEDLPSKNLNIFSEKIKKTIEQNLKKNSIIFSSIDSFYTNIRLVFVVNEINQEIILEKKIIKGPPLDKCFDNLSNPTKTGLGFAKKHHTKLHLLKEKEVDGKKYIIYEKPEEKIKVKNILPKIIEESINKVEEQKKMRWGNVDISFIRPIRWILLILDDKHIPATILGIDTNNYTYGNKINSSEKIKINSFEEYFTLLKKEKVEIDREVRKNIIKKEIQNIASLNRFDENIDNELIDELSNMVEYPYVFLGNFPKKYLDLPKEVLEYVIQDTQKYFIIYQKKEITNFFIGVSNVKINNNIIKGHERVINPRLDDAQFFISKDLSNNIFEKKDFLKRIIFHKKIGSMFDKVQRITELSSYINTQSYADKKLLFKEISEICKLDLMSNMVVEIPKLQGYIGCFYAKKLGIDCTVAEGIKEHYAPRNPEDKIPFSADAQIVSMADKLDTVVGIFLVNEKPTGTRDPLGIRRSTNGFLRILIKTNFSINLTQLINKSYKIISCEFNELKDNKEGLLACHDFFKEKLISIFKEEYCFKEDLILSVVNSNDTLKPYVALKKIQALESILVNPNFSELFANAKRVSNILKKSNSSLPLNFKENLLRESSEKILYNVINDIKDELNSSLEENNYAEYLKKLNNLNPYIKNFFDEVMINTSEEDIKLNRLSLLASVNSFYTNIANISILGY